MSASQEINLAIEPELFGDMSKRGESVGSLTFSNKDLVKGVGETAWGYRYLLGVGGALLLTHATTKIALGAPLNDESTVTVADLVSPNGRTILFTLWGLVEGGIQGWHTYRLNDDAIKKRGGDGMPGKYAVSMPLQGMLREGGTNGMTMWAAGHLIGQDADPALFFGLTAALVVTEGMDIVELVSKPIQWLRH